MGENAGTSTETFYCKKVGLVEVGCVMFSATQVTRRFCGGACAATFSKNTNEMKRHTNNEHQTATLAKAAKQGKEKDSSPSPHNAFTEGVADITSFTVAACVTSGPQFPWAKD
jgi:hypothetical protein